MADFNLKLDEEALRRMASETILAQLTDSERNSILQQAVSYLLTPKNSSYTYGSPKTPLQEAFQTAVDRTARDIARDILDGMPEVKEKMKEIILQAYQKALVEKQEDTVDRIASGIVAAMCLKND